MNSEFTDVQRLILANQYQILAYLASQNKDTALAKIYTQLQETFNKGFSRNYKAIQTDIDSFTNDDDLISDAQQQEVEYLLDMYQYLLNHYKLAKKEYPDLPEIKFIGYDHQGVHEGKKLSYLNFILNTLEAYPDVKKAFKGDTDSHGFTSLHNKMFDTYVEIRESGQLYQKEQINDNVKNILESK